MITAILNYNQSINSSTGYSPSYLIYGPYDNDVNCIFDQTIYETDNEKRRQELLPFYRNIRNKTETRLRNALEKRNSDTENKPDVVGKDIYIKTIRRNEGTPKYRKMSVQNQKNKMIEGTISQNIKTSAMVSSAKRLRQVPFFQDHRPHSPTPGPSSSF